MSGNRTTTAKLLRNGADDGGPKAPVPDLFTLAPHSDQDTSRAAAKAIVPHLERLESAVLLALEQNGPLTAEQLEYSTGLRGDTVRPRLCRLRAMGMVVDSGERRRTRSGRMAVVWRRV